MELEPHEHLDEQGNVVGPTYVISPDGDLLYFVSPSAMGYRVRDQLAAERRKGRKKPPGPGVSEPVAT